MKIKEIDPVQMTSRVCENAYIDITKELLAAIRGSHDRILAKRDHLPTFTT